MTSLTPISSPPSDRADAGRRAPEGAAVEGDTFSALFDAKMGASSPSLPNPTAGATAPSTPWSRADSTPERVAGPEGQWGARRAPAEETPRADRSGPTRKEDATERASDDEGAGDESVSDGREGAAQADSTSEATASEDAAEPATPLRLAKTGAAVTRAETTEAAADEAAVEGEAEQVAAEAVDAPDIAVPAPLELAAKPATKGAGEARIEGVGALSEGPRGPTALGPAGRVTKTTAGAGASGFDADLIERLQAGQQLAQLKDGRLRLSIDEGGDRVTVTLVERDGSVSLAARTASKATAEALESHIQELEAALFEHGLSLDSFEAHSDEPSAEDEPGPASGASEGSSSEDGEVARALPIFKRRIIA